MTEKRLRLCTICARGGSQGVPGKNLRLFAGIPLIAHSVRHAIDSGLFELVVVDSDSPAILEAAAAFGADLTLLRPKDLASSTAAKLPVIGRAANEAERLSGLEFSTFVDLDCTSPLRALRDIEGAVDLVETGGANNVISVTPAHRSPYFNLVETDDQGRASLSKPSDVVRRQDSPKCFDINGSVYVWDRHPFIDEPFLFGDDTRVFSMPRERSIDIDEPLDVAIVEMLLERRNSGDGEHALERNL